MKIHWLILAILGLVAFFGCSSDDNTSESTPNQVGQLIGSSILLDEEGIYYHDAIDLDPSPFQEQREAALGLLAMAIFRLETEADYRALTFNSDSIIDNFDKRGSTKKAEVLVSAEFFEEGGWVEKEAAVSLVQTEEGGWILGHEYQFTKTEKQRNLDEASEVGEN